MKLGDLQETQSVKPKKEKKVKAPKVKKEKAPKAPKTPKMPKASSPEDKKKQMFNIALGVSIAGFVICLGSLLWYNLQAAKAKSTFSKYGPTIVKGEDDFEETQKMTFVNVNGTYVWDRYVEAYMKNNDCIGWINIPDTVIDYPVAHSADDLDFYLHHDLDKKYSVPGTIFIDMEANYNTMSNNVTFYGHHMRNGSMFASLDEYESEKYYKKHKNIIVDTINGRYTYEVIAAFRIATTDDFKYANLNEAKSRDEVVTWLKEIQSRSYLKDLYATADDQFITLSTCDYHQRNGRFAVVARQVSNSESYEATYISLDEYKQLQKQKAEAKKEKKKDKKDKEKK